MGKGAMICFIIIIASIISVGNANLITIPKVINSTGVVYERSNFSIPLKVNATNETVPADIVLVVDVSPSMDRYMNVIHKKTINLSYEWCSCRCMAVPIDNFTLERTSNVMVILSYSNEVYWNNTTVGFDRILVGLDKPPMGCCCGCGGWNCTDPTAFTFTNVSPGKHTVYLRMFGCPSRMAEIRELIVALPPSRIDVAKNESKRFIGLLGANDRVAVVRLGSISSTKIVLNLTSDKTLLNETIDSLRLDSWICVGGGCRCCGKIYEIYEETATGVALQKACDVLNESKRESVKAIILLTDGGWNAGISPIDIAYEAKSLGYRIYTIGIGAVNEALLKEIASIIGGKYYTAKNERALEHIYEEIIKDITVAPKNVIVSLNLTNSTYVSANPLPTIVHGNHLEWHFNDLKNDTRIDVTIVPNTVGNVIVGKGELSYDREDESFVAENFHVVMNVTGNLILNVSYQRNVVEGNYSNITVKANYPLATLNVTSIPVKINKTNSYLKVVLYGKIAYIIWKPYTNFVNGVNYIDENITITASSVCGLKNETHTHIRVWNLSVPTHHHLKPKVSVKYLKGNIYVIEYRDESKPKNVYFTIDNVNLVENSIITAFRKSATTWVVEIAPLYEFTNELNHPLVVNVTFYNGHDSVREAVTINNTNVTMYPLILNHEEVTNVTTKRVGLLFEPKTVYVGSLVRLNVSSKNASETFVLINGMNFSGNTVFTFIPNTAGNYTVSIKAVNSSNVTIYTFWWKVPMRIRPVTPW